MEFVSLARLREVVDAIKQRTPTVKDYAVSLGTTWSGSPLTQEVAWTGILSTDTAFVDIVVDSSRADAQEKEWGKITKVEILDSKVKFYAKEKTASALSVKIKVVNK